MRKYLSAVGLLLGCGLAWFLLRAWTPGGSERFYLLVPPVYVGLYSLLSPRGWRGLVAQLRPALFFLGVMSVLCTLYYLHMASLILPGGPATLLQGLSWWEVLVTVYFLAGVMLIVLLPITLLRWLGQWCDGRLFGPLVEGGRLPPRRRLVRNVLPAVLLVPVLLPYLLGVMYVHCLKMPNFATPRQLVGREYEDVTFTTADGMTLRGWFLPARQPSARTLLICHGLGINRSHVLSYHVVGDELQANVFFFDFRGHGESDGHTVTLGYREQLDVLAAVDYLRRQRPEQAQSVIGLGISMGSAALTRAAAVVEPPLEAVILDSGFAAATELTDNVLSHIPVLLRPLLAGPGVPIASLHAGCELNHVRPIDSVSDLRAPLLIIHARGDRLIPVEHATRLFERAAEPKSLWIADAGDHCSAWGLRHQYLGWIHQFRLPEFASR